MLLIISLHHPRARVQGLGFVLGIDKQSVHGFCAEFIESTFTGLGGIVNRGL